MRNIADFFEIQYVGDDKKQKEDVKKEEKRIKRVMNELDEKHNTTQLYC